MEKWNEEVWRIEEFIPPQPRLEREELPMEIEVDPVYLNPGEV